MTVEERMQPAFQLKPELASGTVVFEVDKETGLEPMLIGAGAQPVRFHTMAKVATTAEQKRGLRETTRADAVEMESRIIGDICREQSIPSGIIRVILDTAQEDLALDFNQLMTTEQKMDYGKLAWALAKSPGKIRGLMRLQKQARTAAERLGAVLTKILSAREV